MKICIIASGDSIHVRRWANYFSFKGHEVHLISSRFSMGAEEFDPNVQIYPLLRLLPRIWKVSGYISGLFWLFQVRILLRQIKPDILNAHYIGVPAYLAAASGFHPLVLTALGSDILLDTKRSFLRRIFTKKALKNADSIIWVSLSLKEELIKLGAAAEKVIITTIGIDTTKFSPKPKSKALFHKLDINTSPVVISTRSLDPIYDVETLIRAAPLILREVPKTKFIIVGDGSQRNYLENLADKLGVFNSLRFTGWISHDSLPSFLRSSDVYVSTALSDSLGISTMEARACGIPAVVGDLPATREWVVDGANGLIFPLRDYKALAEKVIILLKSDDLRRQLGDAGRQLVLDRADYEKEMDKITKLYEALIL